MEKFENFESMPDRAKAILAKKIFFFDNKEIVEKYKSKIVFDLFDKFIFVDYTFDYNSIEAYDNFIGSMKLKFSIPFAFLSILLNSVVSLILFAYIVTLIVYILPPNDYIDTMAIFKLLLVSIGLLILVICINIRKYKKKLYDILLDLCIDQSKTNHLFNFGFVILSTRQEYLLSGNIRIDFYFVENIETKLYNIILSKENRNDK